MSETGSMDGTQGRGDSPELSRELGLPAVFATATGTMIGAGIFILPGVAAAGAGPGAALSFLFAGLITCVAAMSVSELATAMPKAGGDYYFVSRAAGPLVGAIVGVGAWLALVLKGAFALVGLGQYVFYFSPIPILLTAGIGGLALTLLNVVGAKASGTLQNWIVVGLLIIMTVFAVVGLTAVESETMTPLLPFGWGGVFSTTGVVFISYLGVMKAAAISGEVKNPGRNLPLGILSSVVVVTVLYVLTMVIVTGVLPLAEIEAASAPLADAGGLFLGAAGALVVAVAGLLATLSTGNAALLASSRYPFAMARDRLITDWISQINRRFQTPARSILVTGAVMTGLALLLDVEGLAKLGGAFGVIIFAMVNLSVVILRRANPDWYQPSFRVPLSPVLPVVGAVAALSILPGMGLVSHLSAVGLALLAGGWYVWRRGQVERQGGVLKPEFGLADRLQELQQLQSLEDKRLVLRPDQGPMRAEAEGGEPSIQVVVEVEEGRPFKHLIGLAAAFGHRYQAPIDVVMITEVPYQLGLDSVSAGPDRQWMAKLRSRADEHGVDLRFHHVLARDRAKALLAFDTPDARIILIDWHETFRLRDLLGSYVDRVLRQAASRVAVLKYRGNRQYEDILVATAGSPYAMAEVELADAVATFTGATLTFMMVLPPSASSAREAQARSYLEKLNELTRNDAELILARGSDVREEILKAARDRDLLVLGASREVSLRTLFGRHVIGQTADELAERTSGSILLTRDPRMTRRLSSGLRTWVGRWFRRLTGRSARPPRPIPVELEGSRVEAFPRDEDGKG